MKAKGDKNKYLNAFSRAIEAMKAADDAAKDKRNMKTVDGRLDAADLYHDAAMKHAVAADWASDETLAERHMRISREAELTAKKIAITPMSEW